MLPVLPTDNVTWTTILSGHTLVIRSEKWYQLLKRFRIVYCL